jgi:hypothetical protein
LLVTRRAIAGLVRCRKTAANKLAKNRAIRSNLFCGCAAKKDFRYYPGCMGEQRFCPAKSRPAPYAAFGPAAILLRKIATKPLRTAGWLFAALAAHSRVFRFS